MLEAQKEEAMLWFVFLFFLFVCKAACGSTTLATMVVFSICVSGSLPADADTYLLEFMKEHPEQQVDSYQTRC